MQSLIICALILAFISPCICIGFVEGEEWGTALWHKQDI